ncbi:MAG TPA: hypothetical protein VGQ30_02280, partial [Gemmatimonadaceae bacterium]|nr:hypothetical protein [Gemmatimonadaceae bacterium]
MTTTIDRRTLLKWAALAAVTPSAGACAGALRPASFGPDARRFARVRVSPERVIRQVVGLRPYRKSGFRVAAESFGDKTIVHNYGHGGGG